MSHHSCQRFNRTAAAARIHAMIDPGELKRRGLYDPEAPNADDRLALLRWLEEQGASLDEMVDAKARGRLTGMILDRAIHPGERFNRAELAARAGIQRERIEQINRAVSLTPVESEAHVYADDSVKTFRVFEAAAALFGERAVLEFTRTLGSALARVAEAAVSLFLVNVEAPLMARRPSEPELAKANLEGARFLAAVPDLMDSIFRGHMAEAIRRSDQAQHPPPEQVVAIHAARNVP